MVWNFFVCRMVACLARCNWDQGYRRLELIKLFLDVNNKKSLHSYSVVLCKLHGLTHRTIVLQVSFDHFNEMLSQVMPQNLTLHNALHHFTRFVHSALLHHLACQSFLVRLS
jgi:hypothetical protein